VAWGTVGTVWIWPLLWALFTFALFTFALFKWGPRSASETGKTPWTLLGTRGNILTAALVGLVAPLLAAVAWPIPIILWAVTAMPCPTAHERRG
jgi:hypothetical protein